MLQLAETTDCGVVIACCSNCHCLHEAYNATCWVCMWGISGCKCAMSHCTRLSGLSMDSLLLCSGRGASHLLSDIHDVIIVLQRWGVGVLTWHCRGYWTTFLRGILLASCCRSASLSMGKQRILWRSQLLVYLMICKTTNNLYDRSQVSVRAFGRCSWIYMLLINNGGIVFSACQRNGCQDRLLFEWPESNSKHKGGVVFSTIDRKLQWPMKIRRDEIA